MNLGRAGKNTTPGLSDNLIINPKERKGRSHFYGIIFNDKMLQSSLSWMMAGWQLAGGSL
jgi:hypothetical protein